MQAKTMHRIIFEKNPGNTRFPGSNKFRKECLLIKSDYLLEN